MPNVGLKRKTGKFLGSKAEVFGKLPENRVSVFSTQNLSRYSKSSIDYRVSDPLPPKMDVQQFAQFYRTALQFSLSLENQESYVQN